MTPAAIDSTRSEPAAATARQAAGTSPGFTAITVPSAGTGVSVTSTPGKIVSSSARRVAIGSTIDQLVGPSCPGLEQPSDEGFPHAPAADDLEPSHGRDATGRAQSGVATSARAPWVGEGPWSSAPNRPTSSYTTSPAAITPPMTNVVPVLVAP